VAGGSLTAANCIISDTADIAINWCGGWHHAKRLVLFIIKNAYLKKNRRRNLRIGKKFLKHDYQVDYSQLKCQKIMSKAVN